MNFETDKIVKIDYDTQLWGWLARKINYRKSHVIRIGEKTPKLNFMLKGSLDMELLMQ